MQVRGCVQDGVWDRVRHGDGGEVRDPVRDGVHHRVWHSLWHCLRAEVRGRICVYIYIQYIVFISYIAKMPWHHILGLLGSFRSERLNPSMLANLGKDEDEAELANATRGIPFNWHSRGMCPPPHCVHYTQSTNMQRTALRKDRQYGLEWWARMHGRERGSCVNIKSLACAVCNVQCAGKHQP